MKAKFAYFHLKAPSQFNLLWMTLPRWDFRSAVVFSAVYIPNTPNICMENALLSADAPGEEQTLFFWGHS